MKILIDAGHQQGKDPGAIGQCIEVEHNLAIRENIKKFIDIIEVPNNTTLDERIKWINKNSTKDDLLISIHTNAGGGNGIESWYYGGYEPAKDKADTLTTITALKTGEPIRISKPDTQSKYGRFGIIRLTKPYAFLIECGFVDSPDQNDCIAEKTEKYALGIAKFISQYSNIPLKLQTEPQPQPTEQKPPEQPTTNEKPKTDLKYTFNNNLYPGLLNNPEVLQLQVYLQRTGYYPSNYPITGNFLQVTKKSLIKLQIEKGIINSFTDYGAGYCGPKTRAYINNN